MDIGLLLRMRTGSDAALIEFQHLLAAGDPVAVRIYRQHQTAALGPDPLAEGACEWPAALAKPGTVLDVPREVPLYGWRMWRVSGSRLLAPFLTRDSPFSKACDARDPGMEWRPGLNKVSTKRCPQAGAHPRGDCHCGIRAVQSRTILDRFAEQMADRLGPPGAIAQVAMWGRVAAYAPDDDWAHTARAQYARIVSPLVLEDAHEHQRTALERRYGTPLRTSVAAGAARSTTCVRE